MTSREATAYRSRIDEGGLTRNASDWARVLAFGAIGWPWLAKSLYGGTRAEKTALLERLGLAADALPNLGSWKADTGFLMLLIDLITARKPQMIVELGAGASTLIAAKALEASGGGGRIISYDQHADFVDATRAWLLDHNVDADIRHAPIVSPTGRWADQWYHLTDTPLAIDMLIIDGPPWAIDPTVRAKASRLFDRMRPGGTVILDDAARPGERMVARRWQREWPQVDWQFVRGIKGTLVGRWP